MHTTTNGKLQTDAVAATLTDAVCACRVYVQMSLYMCRSGAMEVMVGGRGHVGVYCVYVC